MRRLALFATAFISARALATPDSQLDDYCPYLLATDDETVWTVDDDMVDDLNNRFSGVYNFDSVDVHDMVDQALQNLSRHTRAHLRGTVLQGANTHCGFGTQACVKTQTNAQDPNCNSNGFSAHGGCSGF